MIKFFEKYWGLSLVIAVFGAACMFYVSSLQFPPPSEPGLPFNSIAYHFLAYFLLTAFLLLGLVRGNKRYLVIPALLIAVLYGITDEFHQFFVPSRSMSLFDLMIDSLGGIVATIIYIVSLDSKRAL